MTTPVESLLAAFSLVGDPRRPRGVRHPFASLLALTVLGLLCRQTDLASLQRFAEDYWDGIKDALGFTRPYPPHATTISRALARFSTKQFQDAFAVWLTSLIHPQCVAHVAVDGKTSKQGHDAAGKPIHMLNVFAHEVQVCLAQFPVGQGKPTEPQALIRALDELIEKYPYVKLFTGDALFCQRPLVQALLNADRDYIFAVKENQPDLLEAIQTAFGESVATPPDVQTVEKKGVRSIPASFGFRKERLSTILGKRPTSPESA